MLRREIERIAPPGLFIGHRLITPGDEDALRDDEAASIASPITAVRRASGAARIVARGLLARLGHGPVALPKAPSGAPVWPAGIVGSLAHDDRIAVAAVGSRRDYNSVGIDIEPAVPLPPDMLALVVKPEELPQIADDPLGGKVLFAIKEAVYKAIDPLDGTFLEFQDIAVDLRAGTATTRAGRAVTLRYSVSSHVLALAFSQAGSR
ncbi:MAG: 4'-phosphopantetheinyl transferase superfamily protein [Alphaproteobacteria bacterium]|nr:MAG: 4'-phosphopantetheinyl transferase superfamily protein [Alphaproteobacteria bacterium]